MKKPSITVLVAILTLLLPGAAGCSDDATGPDPTTPTSAEGYVVVDTGQSTCYDDSGVVADPAAGEPFHGQDAQYQGAAARYSVSANGLTVTDATTGLLWTRSADTDGDGVLESEDELTWAGFQARAEELNAQTYAGYDDWRRPTIKELYSLIDFRGTDPDPQSLDASGLTPFLDTDYFDFAYGDPDAGERIIDAQYWSDTQYVGTVFGGEAAVFGVNFADGRIKGYPRDTGPGGVMTHYALFVRGNPDYGLDDFQDNGDGTVTDRATGLMWMQADSGEGMTWEQALAWAEDLSLAGHDDWRLPNAKELQSLVDYTRSPSTSSSPAIDPVFSCTGIVNEAGQDDWGYYWTSTTHAKAGPSPGQAAAYVAFGRALGYFGPPGMEAWVDVHGAGCQRSDPKAGDAADYPYGRGPQGDAIRILNFVRAVRDADAATEAGPVAPSIRLHGAPNPFDQATLLQWEGVPAGASVQVEVYDVKGRLVDRLGSEVRGSGGRVLWSGRDAAGRALAAGIYYARLRAPGESRGLPLVKLR